METVFQALAINKPGTQYTDRLMSAIIIVQFK